MTWTLCSSGAAIAKAGANANSTIIASAARLLEFATSAEGFICAQCHNDFVTNYSSQDTLIKAALADVCSAMVAMDIVTYDPTGYLTREADMIMNKCDERYSQGMKTLTIKQNQKLN